MWTRSNPASCLISISNSRDSRYQLYGFINMGLILRNGTHGVIAMFDMFLNAQLGSLQAVFLTCSHLHGLFDPPQVWAMRRRVLYTSRVISDLGSHFSILNGKRLHQTYHEVCWVDAPRQFAPHISPMNAVRCQPSSSEDYRPRPTTETLLAPSMV